MRTLFVTVPSTLLVALGLGVATPLSAQRVLRSHVGAVANGYVGGAVANLGDLDHDGVDDYAIGATGDSYGSIHGRGAVRVYSGRTGKLMHTAVGWAANIRFGWSIAAIDDVDGDGVTDYAVGAPYDDPQQMRGAVSMRSGKDGHELWRTVGYASDRLGRALTRLQDSPVDDVVASGVSDSGTGTLLQLRGSDGFELAKISNLQHDGLGTCLAHAGDLNGDGNDEILAGAPAWTGFGYNLGAVFVYEGGQTLMRQVGFVQNPSYTYDQGFGTAVAAIGDVDGDGRSELVVSSMYDLEPGDVYLVDGATLQSKLVTSVQGATGYGFSLAALGDVDRDGVPDYGVGEPDAAGGGSFHLFSGDGSQQPFATMKGTGSERFGFAAANLGDIDGDGVVDVLIGSPNASSSLSLVGRADLLEYAPAGSVSTFGTPCVGPAGALALQPGGNGAAGSTLYLDTIPLLGSHRGLLIVGSSNQSFGGVPLPLGLLPFGAPSCSLWVAPDVIAPVKTVPLSPFNPQITKLHTTLVLPTAWPLRGLTTYMQYALLDANAPGGITTSNGLAVTIGR